MHIHLCILKRLALMYSENLRKKGRSQKKLTDRGSQHSSNYYKVMVNNVSMSLLPIMQEARSGLPDGEQISLSQSHTCCCQEPFLDWFPPVPG